MTLIKSISGIRGTIGGKEGEALTPIDIVRYTSAFGLWAKKQTSIEKKTIVIGRDARMSGEMVRHIVVGSLISVGIDVVDLGISTTPTVEMAVKEKNAVGGIILTASHNPKQWNALKLLNKEGEFVSEKNGKAILDMARSVISFNEVDTLGEYTEDKTQLGKHVQAILDLPLVDVPAIKQAKFKIVVDAINSSGSIAVPHLLAALGVEQVKVLHKEMHGNFAHNPEPLPENLSVLSKSVKESDADLGIVVDPDVDRLAFVCEDGTMYGEEYTLVAVSEYVLSHTKQQENRNTVSNLSSTRALDDISEKYLAQRFTSKVGEVNVVEKMKQTNAVIGGEGNGGIIYPSLHYGRDALVGIALFLSHLAKLNISVSRMRQRYPNYYMSKNKIELSPSTNLAHILSRIEQQYENERISTIDGVKIDFKDSWIHLRKSNTEPIIRIYAEAKKQDIADKMALKMMEDIQAMV